MASDDIRVNIDNVQTESTPAIGSEKACTNEMEVEVAHFVEENAELKMQLQEISKFFEHEVYKLKQQNDVLRKNLEEVNSNQGMIRTSSTAGKEAPPIFCIDDTKVTPDIPCSAPEIVGRFTKILRTTSEIECWAMHKVPHRLREVKPIAYEPNVISIGPYHYGKQHLTGMDVIKQSCFTKMLEEKKLELGEFVEAMRTLNKRARECYELPIQPNLTSDVKFGEMMIHDGCFIVQLIRDMYPTDYLARLGRHVQNDMWYDLLLLENQIPFSVLLELDRMIAGNGGGDPDDFARSALSFFQIDTYGPQIWSGSGTYPSPAKDIKHLLDLVHKCCCPSPQGIKQHKEFKEKMAPRSTRSWKFIRCASELEDAGIDFFGEKVKSLFDVTFEKETTTGGLNSLSRALKIPTLRVDDNTERMLRNFMAYEQFTRFGEPTYISDYAVLMDNLINSGKDVQLLCNSRVIDNWLGDDEVVAEMFNKLRDSIYSSDDFYYAEIFDQVDKHYNRSWNKYKAILRKDYFSSPWSLCSFVAAIVLLVVTLLQTAYTLIPYYYPS